jgi:phosphoribosylformylglycinamidine synthase
MLILPGSSALSTFRLQKLLTALRSIDDRVLSVSARFVHFADVAKSLDEKEQQLLNALLTYGPRELSSASAGNAQLILVVPRPGTISPWSSKATDIAHVCGLTALTRVERGIAYSIATSSPLDRAALQQLAPLLHDRMVEAALFAYDDANRLFAHGEPRKLSSVDVLSGGRAALVQANAALGLALSDDEIDYLVASFNKL